MEFKKRVFDLLVERGYSADGFATSDKVINDFIDIIEQVHNDIKIGINEEKEYRVFLAIELLKSINIKKIEICRFGIFYEYECAGESISVNILDGTGGVKIDQESYDKLYDLLNFIDEDYISDVIGYSIDGQNKLILTHDGFIVENFRV